MYPKCIQNASKLLQNISKMLRKCIQNATKMYPKSFQNISNMQPKNVLCDFPMRAPRRDMRAPRTSIDGRIRIPAVYVRDAHKSLRGARIFTWWPKKRKNKIYIAI